jgi:hypothetical protein
MPVRAVAIGAVNGTVHGRGKLAALLLAGLVLWSAWSATARAQTASTAQADAPVEALSAANTRQQQMSELRVAIEHVQDKREHTSTLSAWLFTAAGVALAATGLAIGAGSALGCKGSCTTTFWPGWLVIGGTTMGTVGIVWIVRKEHDIAELTSRRYQLEQELQRVEWNTPASTGSEPRAALTWHGSF